MKKKVLIVIYTIIVIVTILWLIGIIPKIIGVHTANKYVKENYKEMNLKYNYIEYSTAYGDYIVNFIDKENNVYNFRLNSKYFPTSVEYDSIIKSVVPATKFEENNNEQESFVGTILEETTTYMIVEPNEDEAERKSSDKIVINYKTDNKDYLYGVGRKVVVYYTGHIMETYPAQINTNNISITGYSNFEISVEKSENKEINKILNNKDLYINNSDYDLYYYGISKVNIEIDGQSLKLEDALRSGKITIEGIIQKANIDLENAIITGDMYKDGGSMVYKYNEYTIIKRHTISGNRDVYIGIPEMKISDVN